MKTLDKIPTGKIERAGKLVKTGVKVGGNYVKYYSKKLINPDTDKEQLNQDNATDIYDGLKTLKGSALKVAQMLSMEKKTCCPGPMWKNFPCPNSLFPRYLRPWSEKLLSGILVSTQRRSLTNLTEIRSMQPV